LFSLVLIVVADWALYGTRPPRAEGLQAPLDQFSAARAMSHLPHFAARPHPIGSETNQQAREYLVETLRALGAEVQVETTTGIHARGRFVRAGTAQNILGRFPGSANSRAVMLVAHYDSVPEGPGAADDGAGVIAILETVRALRTGAPLQNDLVVLLTDGEEPGLLGAAGFAADHPDLAARVGVVLNLEARGSSGPAMMFETSDQNGWLVPELARAAPYPLASSLTYTVYKILPNDTDLSELKTTGVAAFNFAFTETFQNYHSRLDTKEALDPRSVQHLGANALGLTRHFGNLPLTNLRKPDCVYFNWLGHRLLVYPMWVVWVLAVATFALLGFAFALARRRSLMKLTVASLGAFFVLLLAVAGGMLLIWEGIKLVIGDSLLVGDTLSNQLLFGGLIAIGFALGTVVLAAFGSKPGARQLHAGLLLVAAVLATVVAVLLPGGSYLFQWPVLFGAGSLLLGLNSKSPIGLTLWGLVAAIPSILILAPITYFFFVVLDLNLVSLLVASILLSLLLAVAWPIFDFIIRPWRGTAISAALLALALIISGAALSHSSAPHPRRDTLLYSLNVDQRKAKWVSYDEATDSWTRQFLGTNPSKGSAVAFTVGSDRNCLSADAPLVNLEAPSASVVSDRMKDAVRMLRLHLVPARHAQTMVVRLPAEADLRSVTWNDRTREIHASEDKQPWSLRYDAVPPEGVDLELHLRGPRPLQVWLADWSPGFPEIAGRTYDPRPDDLMADGGSDITLVGRQYTF